MKRANTVADALNTGSVLLDFGGNLPKVAIPLDGDFGGEPGPPGAGVPSGGSALQVVRKNAANTTTEWADVNKSLIGLHNVDNTSDVNKPVSNATQIALGGKADKTELSTKADLVGGKIPVAQLPATGIVTDSSVAAQVNSPETGAEIDGRITTQATPLVQPIVADYIASSQVVVDAAAAAVDANPKIVELENRPLGRHLGATEHLDTVLTVGDSYVDADSEATLALGFPVARAGKLRVDRFRPSDASLVQIYYPFRHPGFFIRYIYQSTPYVGAPYGSANNGWAEYKTWAEVQSAIASAIAVATPPARSSTTSVACIGDSLTAGYSSGAAWADADSYPSKLATFLGAGVTVTKLGFSGSTSDQINTRVGALPLEMKIPDGIIPESGSMTLASDQVIGAWGGTVDFNAYGYLDGVYGLLQYTEAGGYTFLRSGSGAAVVVSRATFLGEFKEHATHTLVAGFGRNDITKLTTGMEPTIVDHVMRGYADLMAYATPLRKQVVLLGTITRTDESTGSAGFEAVHEIRSRLRALYPANFLDLQGYLIGADVWTHTGITPNQADLDAQALGKTPPSLFDDVTHYSRATAQAIAEHLVGPFLKQKGYV